MKRVVAEPQTKKTNYVLQGGKIIRIGSPPDFLEAGMAALQHLASRGNPNP